MESYKCGTNVAATFCQNVLKYDPNDIPGMIVIKCNGETISTTKKNEWNPDYGNIAYANDPEKPGQMN